MEFCGVFYETGYLRAVYDKIRKLFFVFLMAAVLTVGMMGQGMETINFGSVRLQDMAGRASGEYEKGAETAGTLFVSAVESIVSAESLTVLSVMPDCPTESDTKDFEAVISGSGDGVSNTFITKESVSDISLNKETAPQTPIIENVFQNDSPIRGEMSEAPEIDENVLNDSVIEDGNAGDKTIIGGGFVTDASGMICGISDLSVISEDGYLILPSEGCRGIAAGAFASCKDIISEIYIPANISEIEERAFTDLTSLGWIEMEASAGYYTEDGVLFSKDGTCLLAFPPARTGNYKVPSHVTEIADGAFDRAGISVLDASDCSVLEIRSLPSYIEMRR